MKVVSILELQSQVAGRRFSNLRAAGGKREPFMTAMTAAGTTIQTGLALFLERELGERDSAQPTLVSQLVADGLLQTRREWLSAARQGHQVYEGYVALAAEPGQSTYESALAEQSARRWHDAAYAAARAMQIAQHWRESRVSASNHQVQCAA